MLLLELDQLETLQLFQHRQVARDQSLFFARDQRLSWRSRSRQTARLSCCSTYASVTADGKGVNASPKVVTLPANVRMP